MSQLTAALLPAVLILNALELAEAEGARRRSYLTDVHLYPIRGNSDITRMQPTR